MLDSLKAPGKKGRESGEQLHGARNGPLAGREMTRASFDMACLAYRVRKLMLLLLCFTSCLWWL
jgi:hypothetical protein